MKSFTVAECSIYFVHNIMIYNLLNALSQRTTFAWPIAIDHYYLHYCKICFVSTIPIHNFCMHYWILQLKASQLQMTIVCNCGICYFFKCYDNCWFILALLQLATFVSTIAINNCCISIHNFCIHHCYWHLLYALL